jgi:alcohol dehydrogenase class IV
VKFVIVSWRNLPSVSINDPLLMVGKPAGLTAATGMDALTHAVEAYISKDANPVTDASAIQAIKLIATNLRQAVALGTNIKARENMACASLRPGWRLTMLTSVMSMRWLTNLAACTTWLTVWQTPCCYRTSAATT